MRVNNNRINNSNNVSKTNTNLPHDWSQIINFKEKFDYSEVDNEDYLRVEIDNETEILISIFKNLIRRIVKLGLDLRHGKRRRQGDFILEAYFVPKKKGSLIEAYILLPLNINYNLEAKALNTNQVNFNNAIDEYVSRVIDQTDNRGLIRLLVILAHEFGHFLSSLHGNHDQELARGLLFMHRNQVIGFDRYTSLVFFEESLAWRYGKEVLSILGFVWWEVFAKIKTSSLRAYYQRLCLDKASLPVYLRLAQLDDFRSCALPLYFT